MQQPKPISAEADDVTLQEELDADQPEAVTPPSPGDTRVEAMMAAYERILADRLEEGVRAIQRSGLAMMQEIAAEVWRVAGGDKEGVRSSLVEALSRDQAIRGLIAHSDERFQSLSLRAQRLEDLIGGVAESTRSTKQALAQGVQALRDAAASASVEGVEDVKAQLTQIERHLAATFERLDERDRLLVGQLQEQIRDYGAIVRHETGRIVEALEGYVKDGVGAIGQLAQRIEERTEMMYERVGMDTRSITEALSSHESWVLRTLEASSARVDESLASHVDELREIGRGVSAEVARSLEQRVQALAELIRSDSESVRTETRSVVAAERDVMTRIFDERIRQSDHELVARLNDAVSVIDRNMVRVADTLDSELERLGQRVAQAVDAAAEGRFDAIDRRIATAEDGFGAAAAQMTASTEGLERALDERVAALARMIRADNRVIAEHLHSVGEHDQAKQALRAVKELQASMPGEIMAALDRRLAALREQLSRSDEAIAQKVDRLASRVTTQRYDQDIQSVIERMGDAMHALASLGRIESDRIELD